MPIRYFHYIHENCRMIKCIYNGKRYSIIIVNARFKVALGMHMQLDVVITFKNLRIQRPSFRQNNTLKSRLASDQILWIEQSNRVIIRLLIHQEWYIKIVSDLVCHYQAFDIWYIVLLYPASKEIFPEILRKYEDYRYTNVSVW